MNIMKVLPTLFTSRAYCDHSQEAPLDLSELDTFYSHMKPNPDLNLKFVQTFECVLSACLVRKDGELWSMHACAHTVSICD